MVVAADDKILKFGKILGILPDQQLVLMKFNHRPKAFVPLAADEPKIGDTIALLPLSFEDPWAKKIPPVVGPITAKRSGVSRNLREARFIKVLSLGAGLSSEQLSHIGPESFAINSNGELVAFWNGYQPSGRQRLITLSPIAPMAEKIRAWSKGGQDMGFPLPDQKNPFDLVGTENDFRRMSVAMEKGNFQEAERLSDLLEKRHPKSPLLKSVREDHKMYMLQVSNSPSLKLLSDFPEPQVSDPIYDQVNRWSSRGLILAKNKQDDAAIEAFKKAASLGPDDYPDARLLLATLHAQRGRPKEAEAILKEIFPQISDSIIACDMYRQLLLELKKFKESDEKAKRANEMENIYRIR